MTTSSTGVTLWFVRIFYWSWFRVIYYSIQRLSISILDCYPGCKKMWLTHFSSAQKFYLVLGLFSMGTETLRQVFLVKFFWITYIEDFLHTLVWYQWTNIISILKIKSFFIFTPNLQNEYATYNNKIFTIERQNI